jgi:hypothetical protein
MKDSRDLMMIMMMNTLGLSVLYGEFRTAYSYYSQPKYHPNYKKAASDSLAFIQGTGLDLLIQAYGLMYDPDALRNVFFSMVGDHAKIIN